MLREFGDRSECLGGLEFLPLEWVVVISLMKYIKHERQCFIRISNHREKS